MPAKHGTRVFGRMRRDWEAMRSVCVDAMSFVDSCDRLNRTGADFDQKMALERLGDLRVSIRHLREDAEAPEPDTDGPERIVLDVARIKR